MIYLYDMWWHSSVDMGVWTMATMGIPRISWSLVRWPEQNPGGGTIFDHFLGAKKCFNMFQALFIYMLGTNSERFSCADLWPIFFGWNISELFLCLNGVESLWTNRCPWGPLRKAVQLPAPTAASSCATGWHSKYGNGMNKYVEGGPDHKAAEVKWNTSSIRIFKWV